MFYALSELLLCNEVGGCGNGDEASGVAVDQQHAGADRKRRGFGTGACGHRVPVAEDILETDPAGQSLVERADRNFGDVADEIGVVDRIGLVARDDAGDAAAGDADRGQADGCGGKRCDRDRHGGADAVRDGLQQEACDREHAERQDDQDQQRQPSRIDPEEQAADGAVALGFERDVLADEFADRETDEHRQQFDPAQGDHDRG